MVRTQIQLSEEQIRQLRNQARRRGVSMAALIRQAVDGWLDDVSDEHSLRFDRAASIVGAFEDREGAVDVATRHDDYLDESFA